MTDRLDKQQDPGKAEGTSPAPARVPAHRAGDRPAGSKPVGQPERRAASRPVGQSKPQASRVSNSHLSSQGGVPAVRQPALEDDFDLDSALAFNPDMDLDTRDFEAVSPVRDTRPYVDPRSVSVSADRAMAEQTLYTDGAYQPRHAPSPVPASVASSTTLLRPDALAQGQGQDLDFDVYLDEPEPPHAVPPVTPELKKSKTGKHRRRAGGMLRTLLDLVIVVAIAFLLAWGVRSYVIQPYEIPSGSMESTIVPGDHVLSYKLGYNFGDIQQGDIVTFWNPMHTEQERLTAVDKVLIKRVIATGGQTVDLFNGRVYVDGIALEEPYAQGNTYPLLSTFENMSITYPYRVPEGQLWVMGDNRENSSDSRFFGSIDEDLVTGHAVVIYWPLNHFGKLS